MFSATSNGNSLTLLGLKSFSVYFVEDSLYHCKFLKAIFRNFNLDKFIGYKVESLYQKI